MGQAMRGKWILVAGVALLVAVAAGTIVVYRRAGTPPPPPPSSTPEEPTFTGNEVSLSAKLQAAETLGIPAPMEGMLTTLLVDPGDEVFEGQLLASIDNVAVRNARDSAVLEVEKARSRANSIEGSILAMQLEAARARVAAKRSQENYLIAEKAYRRQEMLLREGATPRLTYEKSAKEYETARQEYESLDAMATQAEERLVTLRKDLETSRALARDSEIALEEANEEAAAGDVRSPVNGLVVAVHGERGKNVEPESGDLITLATSLQNMIAVVEPEPPVLKRIHTGQEAFIYVAEYGQALAGKVKEIQDTRVLVEFISPNPMIRPGLSAQVVIRLEGN